MKQNVFFVSGIDTDAGKSYATGFLAREWNKNGQRTITQKFIQTGNVGHSEDIDLHRRIMGISFTKEDEEGLTMPEIFSYPASPHLASQLDNRPIDFNKIKRATKKLSERYDYVLLEGAGGLMVPLTTGLPKRNIRLSFSLPANWGVSITPCLTLKPYKKGGLCWIPFSIICILR